MTAGSTSEPAGGAASAPVALVDLLDRVLATGVVVTGELALSIAEVDLVHISLRALLSSVRAPAPLAPRAAVVGVPPDGSTGGEPGPLPCPPSAAPEAAARDEPAPAVRPAAGRLEFGRDSVDKGLATLVLTVVELLRQLMERQALRRVDQGDLIEEQIERIGVTLMALDERMAQLREHFGLEPGDLNLDLGPLGPLLPRD